MSRFADARWIIVRAGKKSSTGINFFWYGSRSPGGGGWAEELRNKKGISVETPFFYVLAGLNSC